MIGFFFTFTVRTESKVWDRTFRLVLSLLDVFLFALENKEANLVWLRVVGCP